MSTDLEKQYVEALERLQANPDDTKLEARVARMESDLALGVSQAQLTVARAAGNTHDIARAIESFDEAEMAYLIAVDVEAQSTIPESDRG